MMKHHYLTSMSDVLLHHVRQILTKTTIIKQLISMNSNEYLFGLRPVIYAKAFRKWITLPSSRRKNLKKYPLCVSQLLLNFKTPRHNVGRPLMLYYPSACRNI